MQFGMENEGFPAARKLDSELSSTYSISMMLQRDEHVHLARADTRGLTAHMEKNRMLPMGLG
jgi:hypothetical protein